LLDIYIVVPISYTCMCFSCYGFVSAMFYANQERHWQQQDPITLANQSNWRELREELARSLARSETEQLARGTGESKRGTGVWREQMARASGES
jgi:hypothetical protein